MNTNTLHRVTGLAALVAVAALAIPAVSAIFSTTNVKPGYTCGAYGYQAGYGYGYDCTLTVYPSGGSAGSSSTSAPVVAPVVPVSGTTAPIVVSNEVQSAYDFAFKNKITTLALADARGEDPATRQEIAKMMVNYIKNVRGGAVAADGMKCDITKYGDYAKLNAEMRGYVQQACDMGIMGRQNDKGGMLDDFRPYDLISRAEYGAVLSRILYGEANNSPDGPGWYVKHLAALKADGIMTKIDTPHMNEIRQWIWLMLMRTANK